MLDSDATEQLGLFDLKSRSQSKKLGQFFTETKIAEYMVSMLHRVKSIDPINILDAGAGAGILTLSAAYRCLELGHRQVHAVLYEVDESILSVLEENLEQAARFFSKKSARFTYEIHNQDFVLSRPDKKNKKFHISVINPPYFKYNSKSSPYSGATTDLYKGNPNIYVSFMAVVSSCLVPDGQMVAIVPRSFTNGLYFKGFREYLKSNMSLERIHIFKARNRLFKNMKVLQENIICKHVKKNQHSNIEIWSSTCSNDLNKSEVIHYPSDLIIDASTPSTLN